MTRGPLPPPLLFAFLLPCGCPLAWVKGAAAGTESEARSVVGVDLLGARPLSARVATAERVNDRREAAEHILAVAEARPCQHNGQAQPASSRSAGLTVEQARDTYLDNDMAIGSVRRVAT